MEKQDIYEREFLKPIIFWGAATCLVAAAWSFAPALYLYLGYGVIPTAKEIFVGFGLIMTFAGALWVIEPPSYFPILGVPGTYMAFLSGNISNLRVPVAAVAQSAAGVEEGSREGAIVSTIAIGVSILVNIAILTIGAFFGVKLLEAFPPFINKALNFVLPAVFGGVYGQFALRNYKLAIVALVLCIFMVLVKVIPSWLIVPIAVFTTIYIGIVMKNNEIKRNIAA